MHASTIDPFSLARASERFDFVTALSAEARCALCDELHAAVDQRQCARCGAASCPDCASPDSHASSSKRGRACAAEATWICRACAPRPPQAGLSTRSRRAGVLALPGRLALVIDSLALPRVRFASLRTSARDAHRARTASWRQLRSWLEFDPLAHARQGAFRELGRVARRASASTRERSAHAARALNAHAVGFVLGTAILVAVARADDGRDLR